MLETHTEIEKFLIKKVGDALHPYNAVRWDMVASDGCPLGWGVSVYFDDTEVNFHRVETIVNTIYKAITGHDYEDWDCMEMEHTDDWLKVVFQADLINS